MTERNKHRCIYRSVPCVGLVPRLTGLFLILLTLSVPPVNAQSNGPVVTATVLLSVNKAVQGGTFQVAVVAKVAEGFHVNAHRPTEKWLIPTELTTAALVGVTVEPAFYQKAVEKTLAFSGGDKLALYEGTFTVGLNVRVAKTLAPGKYTLKGVLGYQACNDEMCMAPDEIPVSVEFEVVKARSASKAVHREVFSKDPFVPLSADKKK